MVKSSVIICAIILTISLHKTFSASVYQPKSSYDVNNTNYETAGRKPVTQEDGDETSQEDADDENDNSDDSTETGEYEEDRNCSCSGSNCVCCINLNLSFIDLGGPGKPLGCVKFAYIPQNDSMAVNVSYGERLLESSMIKRDSPEPACMDLFSDLAQMCAKFSGLSRVAKGVKGCVSVEPLLLGVSQTVYDVGCFNMDVEGLQPSSTHHIQHGSNSTKETTEKPEENEEEEELAAAISQSAEEGIAWFNNFITSVFGEELNETSSETTSETPSRNRPHSNPTKLTS